MVRFENQYNIYIGEHGFIYPEAVISACKSCKICIGNNVLIGPYTMIISFDHSYKIKNKLIKDSGIHCADIFIGNDVWIGGHCSILRGSNIPDGCVIGAGSIITRHCKLNPYCAYAGNPLKLIAERKDGS